jgi:hypothetical protein
MIEDNFLVPMVVAVVVTGHSACKMQRSLLLRANWEELAVCLNLNENWRNNIIGAQARA